MEIVDRILITLLYCAIFFSVVHPQNIASPPGEFTPVQLSEDFLILRQALEEGHSGIYRYGDKGSLDAMFKQMADSLNSPLDEYEFYRTISPMIAAIKCGHTGIGLSAETRNEILINSALLPFQVKIINGKAFVFRDLATKEKTVAGKRLMRINGIPVEEILKTMFRATSADAGIQSAKEWRLSNGWRFNTNLISSLGITSPYSLEVKDPANGKMSKIHIEGRKLPDLRNRWLSGYPQDQNGVQEKEPTASLSFLRNDRVALLKIGSFSTLIDSKRNIRLDDFIRKSFAVIKARASQSLIIDLQNNGGGDDDLGRLLLSYLLDRPFRYYDDIVLNKLTFSFLKYATDADSIPSAFVEKRMDGLFHAVMHPSWGIHQPQPARFSGKVYVLMNGGSFSTTAEFLSNLHFHKRAIFIGEESGGGYYGNSSGFMATVTLPNTKLNLRIPLATYYLAVKGSYPSNHGVIPDYAIHPSINDFLQEKDVSLNYALRLTEGSPEITGGPKPLKKK